MDDKPQTGGLQCVSCGELNPAGSSFCSNCGGGKLRDVPPRLAMRLGLGRVVVVSALSAGLYVVYWFYLTWKQLASETSETHHPVWHALSLFVPIYGLFKMHRHVKVINGLVKGTGIVTSLSPGLAVVILMIGNALDWSSIRVNDTSALVVIGLISTALITYLVASAQSTLNQYWESVRGAELREARFGVGEVVFILVGLLVWVVTFLPAE